MSMPAALQYTTLLPSGTGGRGGEGARRNLAPAGSCRTGGSQVEGSISAGSGQGHWAERDGGRVRGERKEQRRIRKRGERRDIEE